MDLYSGYQVVARYFSDIYTAIYDHVNVQDFHGLPGPERLRSHPVQRREVVVRRLYNLLLPPGTHTYQRLVEFSWHMRLARRLPARTKINIRVDRMPPNLRNLHLFVLYYFSFFLLSFGRRNTQHPSMNLNLLMVRLGRGLDTVHIQISASMSFGAPTFGATWNAAWATGAVVVAVAVIVTLVGIFSSLTIFTVIVFSPVKEV